MLVVAGTDPGRAYQWDTLVLPEHRGHRLGLALKVANLARMQAGHPDRTELHTFNAEDNPPMAAVNDALGFRAVERMGEWQGPVPD
jgi:GNAT superfamily N-acetyltransferase